MTSSPSNLVRRTARLLGCVAVGALAFHSQPAQAAIEVNNVGVIASPGLQAGGHSDISIAVDFCSPSSGYDCTPEQFNNRLKDFALELPPGMVGNPYAVARCTTAPASCPSDSRIGTIKFWTTSNEADPPAAMDWPLYNMPTESGQVGRFDTQISSSIATVNSENAYSVSVNSTAPDISGIKVARVEITLFGHTRPFMQNPTSCLIQPLTVRANSYEDPGTTVVESEPVAATGCGSLAFDPPTSVQAGGAGQTGRGGTPTMSISATQPGDAARARSARFVMPSEIKPTIAGLASHACAPDRVAAGCPGVAPIGQATVDVPALGTPLSGAVYLVKVPGQLALDLTAQLTGPISARFTGRATFNGSRAMIDVTGIPDLPVRSIGFDLFGGSGSILANVANLCNGAGQVEYSYRAHSGAGITGASNVRVDGCQTSIALVSRTVKTSGRNAALRLTCGARGSDCSGELVLATGAGRKAKRVGSTRFTISAGSTRDIRVRMTKTTAKRLGKKRKLKVTASAVTAGGQRASATVTLKAPKKKQRRGRR